MLFKNLNEMRKFYECDDNDYLWIEKFINENEISEYLLYEC